MYKKNSHIIRTELKRYSIAEQQLLKTAIFYLNNNNNIITVTVMFILLIITEKLTSITSHNEAKLTVKAVTVD